jgi:hypothetical protein
VPRDPSLRSGRQKGAFGVTKGEGVRSDIRRMFGVTKREGVRGDKKEGCSGRHTERLGVRLKKEMPRYARQDMGSGVPRYARQDKNGGSAG